PGTPALRKYLLTTMSVASCDHDAGTSTASIWNTTLPSGLAITVRRRSHVTSSSGSTWSRVQRLGTRTPSAWGARVAAGVEAGAAGEAGVAANSEPALEPATAWFMADLPGPPRNRRDLPSRLTGW